MVYEQAAKPAEAAEAAAAAEPAVAAKLAAARSIASAYEANELTAAAAKLAAAEDMAGVYEAIQSKSRDKFQREVIQDKYADKVIEPPAENIAKRQVQSNLKSPKSGSDQRVDSSGISSNSLALHMAHGINRKGKQRNVDPHTTVFKQAGKNKHADFDHFGDNARIGKHCEAVAVQQLSA